VVRYMTYIDNLGDWPETDEEKEAVQEEIRDWLDTLSTEHLRLARLTWGAGYDKGIEVGKENGFRYEYIKRMSE